MANDIATLRTRASGRLGQLYNEAELAADSSWTDPQKLTLACRILAADGHDTVVPGLVSVRTAEPDVFLTLPMGVGLEEVRPGDILTVDRNLNVLHGNGKPPKAVGFLVKMHQLRPDIRCGIHTHAPYTAALSMVDEPLVVAHMDATMFYDEARAKPESGKAGESIEEAAWMALCFERAVKMQVRARAIGQLSPIDPEFARDAHDYLTDPSMVATQFRRFARRVLRDDPACVD